MSETQHQPVIAEAIEYAADTDDLDAYPLLAVFQETAEWEGDYGGASRDFDAGYRQAIHNLSIAVLQRCTLFTCGCEDGVGLPENLSSTGWTCADCEQSIKFENPAGGNDGG